MFQVIWNFVVNWWVVLVVISLVTIVLTIVISIVVRRKNEREKKERFFTLFGFHVSEDWHELQFQQKLVDSRLAGLAREFRNRDTEQREAWAARERVTAYDAKAALQVFKSCTASLEEAKSAFWEAHELADGFGFKMRGSYKDYLKNPNTE